MFGWEGELPQPAARMVEEMSSVLYDPRCRCSDPLYFMYRDLFRSERDRYWLRDQNLRYDITVIPPRNLCGEWVKTKGHYHPTNAAGKGFPEIYEVLDGTAHYLLQSCTLDDIIMITAGAGDLVIIPPGYGHISINPSPDTTLSMANIVSTAFESEYGEYEALHGAAYYELCTGNLVKNPVYPAVPAVRKHEAGSGRKTHWNYTGPLYDLIGNEEALAFLNFPEQNQMVFKAILKG
jgi:glucose-6-phosphate isomerase, archaeal